MRMLYEMKQLDIFSWPLEPMQTISHVPFWSLVCKCEKLQTSVTSSLAKFLPFCLVWSSPGETSSNSPLFLCYRKCIHKGGNGERMAKKKVSSAESPKVSGILISALHSLQCLQQTSRLHWRRTTQPQHALFARQTDNYLQFKLTTIFLWTSLVFRLISLLLLYLPQACF